MVLESVFVGIAAAGVFGGVYGARAAARAAKDAAMAAHNSRVVVPAIERIEADLAGARRDIDDVKLEAAATLDHTNVLLERTKVLVDRMPTPRTKRVRVQA